MILLLLRLRDRHDVACHVAARAPGYWLFRREAQPHTRRP